MKIYNTVAQAAAPIREQIAAAERVLILTHINPDGDAIGSLLGMYHALRSLGKDAVPVATSLLPSYTQWLPGAEHIRIYQSDVELPDVDLVIIVDTASLERIGRIYDEHTRALARLPLVIIDHHATNTGSGVLNLIVPSAASTCELLYELFEALALPISPQIATSLLLGLMTDTQAFRTSSTRASTLRIAAELLDHSADYTQIVHEVYNTLPESSALLIGAALSALQRDGPIVWTVVTQEMLRSTGAEDEAVDEAVGFIQRIKGVQALVVFKERVDSTTKISLRSHPPINVAALAQVWGGGGHMQAAGATLNMTPRQAVAEVLPRLRELTVAAGAETGRNEHRG